MPRLIVLISLVFPVSSRAALDDELFEIKIRPVLVRTCFPCHGGQKTSSGLRVDSRAALLKGGEQGPAVVPSDPEKSLLVRAIKHMDEDLKMPPSKPLPDAVVADFSAWIRDGAPWPADSNGTVFTERRHWAFEPVRDPSPPVDALTWSQHPIDCFLTAAWREKKLHHAELANKRTLIRRVTFDLIGLPPSPAGILAFLNDDSPTAFETVVERLLASPQYGERWGRHWMDVARYADTAGDNADYPVPEARLYRDYIIDSFNADKPYDQFVREQIAGDLIAARGSREQYAERVVATGFLALSRKYATAPEELWHLTLEDAIETTGRTFLGLTLRCARCHDHKFDPVTQRDYYALYGIFASTKFAYAGSEEFASKSFPRAHFVPLLPPAEAAGKLQSYQETLRDLGARLARLEKDDPRIQTVAALNASMAPIEDALAELVKIHQDPKPFRFQLDRLRARRDAVQGDWRRSLDEAKNRLSALRRPGLPPNLPGAYAVQDGSPVDETIHLKGEPESRGKIARRNAPAFLTSQPLQIPHGSSGRLQLAEWLTQPDHPLTARVMVNRIWQHHFGRGIVASSSNLGLRGDEPSHPELLDWLARRFVQSGWSVKAMHRLIVSSKAYQLASSKDADNAAIDPSNRFLWRFDRRRLSAEEIRDAMLALGGHLDLGRPGPHPFPPIAAWGWTQHNAFKAVYPSNHRGVYLMTQRLTRHPFLALFDGPDANHSTDARTSATVPLQSLFFLNNPFVHEQAQGLAQRLLAESTDPRKRVVIACELAWGRLPADPEIDAAASYVERFAAETRKTGASSQQAELEAWASLGKLLISANEFLCVD
jgi:Protein of unknown function (DUF1553)/Protein of unknown function (DUF1549)/Planctomycete cytochrome C